MHAGREHIQGGASILQTSFAHTGAVRWQAQYQHMGPPAAVLLVSEAGDPPGCFAVYDRTGRSPRVYAAKQRDALLRAMQAAAASSLGTSLKGVRPRPAVYGQAACDGQREPGLVERGCCFVWGGCMGQAPVGCTGQDRRLPGVLQLVSGLLVLRSLGLLTSKQLAGCQVWAGLLRCVTTCRVSHSTGPAEAQSLPRLHLCNHGCLNKVNLPGNWAVEVRGRQMTEASMADACRAHCQAVYCA